MDYFIKPNQAESFVDGLAIEKFFGIGKVTAKKMHELGIHTGVDLKQIPMEELVRRFGKVGRYYFDIARAIDNRLVNPNRIRKSLGAERTFEDDLIEDQEILDQTDRVSNILIERMARSKTKGKTITIKLKYNDFEVINRSKTFAHSISEPDEVKLISNELLLKELPAKKGIRLIGVTISNLEDTSDTSPKQLTLDF